MTLMRSLEEHLSAVLALGLPRDPAHVPLAEALGLVLAEDVAADANLPRWDNSAMDGYAVRAADTFSAADAPVVLRVLADLPAGTAERPRVAPGTAARIMTGAPLPPGADAVVPIEATDGGTERVRVDRPIGSGSHVRRAGEDLRRGSVVLASGARLTPVHLAAAAAAGRAVLTVVPAPQVGVVATGSELVAAGGALGPGQIPDSNSVLLAAAVRDAGAHVTLVATVDDRPASLAAVLDGLDGDVDLVVTAGGVSMGAYEVVRDVLEPTGDVWFGSVAMQPGKPQGLGRLARGTPVVCLPGNPVSAFVSFEVFLRPLLAAMGGAPRDAAATGGRGIETVTVDDAWAPPRGRTQFMPVRLDGPPGARRARQATSGGAGSHLVAGLVHADGLLVVPAGTVAVEPGDTFDVRMLR